MCIKIMLSLVMICSAIYINLSWTNASCYFLGFLVAFAPLKAIGALESLFRLFVSF